jgi:DNA-binding PadR family transcriptional regulator
MSAVSQGLSTTSYALLGLLAFDGTSTNALTGYELKQRADKTLRFYWVSPAMSQVYSELDRLSRLRLVRATSEQTGQRTSLRYRLTPAGLDELRSWLAGSEVEFPILKHPMALRLVMGALVGPDRMRLLLEGYLTQLAERRRDLVSIRASLGDEEALRYPAMVADWGLRYYDSEAAVVGELLDQLATIRANGPGH